MDLLSPQIQIIEGKAVTTSRQVADYFHKRHDDVTRKIKTLHSSPEFNARNFVAVEYRDMKGEMRVEYQITRDGFMFLAMGFTGKKAGAFKEVYINEFNRLEEQVRNNAQAKELTPHEELIEERKKQLARAKQFEDEEAARMRTINSAVASLSKELGVKDQVVVVGYNLLESLVTRIRYNQSNLEKAVEEYGLIETTINTVKNQVGNEYFDNRYDTYEKRHGHKQGASIYDY